MASSSAQAAFPTISSPAEEYAVDVSTLFVEILSNRLSCSVHELMQCVRQFERISRSSYGLQTSRANSSVIDSTFSTNQHKHFLYQLSIVADCRKSSSVATGFVWASDLCSTHPTSVLRSDEHASVVMVKGRSPTQLEPVRETALHQLFEPEHFEMYAMWHQSFVEQAGLKELPPLTFPPPINLTVDTSITNYDQLPPVTLLNLDAPALHPTEFPEELVTVGPEYLISHDETAASDVLSSDE
ncbi:hypothetical protein CLF_113236 [Clonorchis sinensis]|uniref:Uncharacterized protein n=1 Tax=Clonorchis sinensis TaxID=79923 RepID=G7YXY8_CLOSI|nr:hypothetical protein CLF_113236 [Clonorchis sinensis]